MNWEEFNHLVKKGSKILCVDWELHDIETDYVEADNFVQFYINHTEKYDFVFVNVRYHMLTLVLTAVPDMLTATGRVVILKDWDIRHMSVMEKYVVDKEVNGVVVLKKKGSR